MSAYYWIGERLWLDAVNSEFMSDGQRTDGWRDPAALQEWLHETVKRHEEAESLRDFSLGNDGEVLLQEAKKLRAALRRACETAHREPTSQTVAPEAVEAVNAALKHRGVALQVERGEGGWQEREVGSGENSDALWLLARSAAHSWTHGELVRLKPCSNPNCILWFLDTSKNGTRRWCSMDACGNRHKVAAHHQRRKQSQGVGS
ncbi:hypothetical protein IAD21_02690 [Abditibacteriota bacterium]|nr:hypothetical protein IAD21_02690 [Abditibacteriota bacterium]